MDDLVQEIPPKMLSKNVGFSGEITDKPKDESTKIVHKTQSTGMLYGNHVKKDDTVVIEKTTVTSTQSLGEDRPRKKSSLDPDEIEEIQARERDAFNFNNLKALLERRVSTAETPYEEWKRQSIEEVRSSLHDSANIKRAMKKWLSMDKQGGNL